LHVSNRGSVPEGAASGGAVGRVSATVAGTVGAAVGGVVGGTVGGTVGGAVGATDIAVVDGAVGAIAGGTVAAIVDGTVVVATTDATVEDAWAWTDVDGSVPGRATGCDPWFLLAPATPLTTSRATTTGAAIFAHSGNRASLCSSALIASREQSGSNPGECTSLGLLSWRKVSNQPPTVAA
jgi:hypothetical protein